MPHSLSIVLVHLVFSTRYRRPVLSQEIAARLHGYLATVARHLKCECYRAGGNEDHVHLALRLSRTICVAELVQKLKTSSSRWLKEQSPELARFEWQRGYAAFSIAPGELGKVVAYIAGQWDHHLQLSFRQEILGMLAQCGLHPDEQFLWD